MTDLLKLAELCEADAVERLKRFLDGGPSFGANLAADAKSLLDCAAALRARASMEKNNG